GGSSSGCFGSSLCASFGHDFDWNLDRHFTMKAHGNGELARLLESLAQRDAATVNFIAALLQSLCDVHRSHGAVKDAVVADLAREAQAQGLHLSGLLLGSGFLFGLFLEK